MATPGREYSLDHHLLEHMKFSGIERQNLTDPRQHRRQPEEQIWNRAAWCRRAGLSRAERPDRQLCHRIHRAQQDHQCPLGHSRLKAITILPLGIPKSAQFDVDITLGG